MSEKIVRGPHRQRSEATRATLVRTAITLMTERGFDQTSLADVAADAGVSKGAVYHHFSGKVALLDAVVQQLQRALRVAVAHCLGGDAAGWGAVAAGCAAYLDLVVTDPRRYRLLLLDGPAQLGWQRWEEIDRAHWHNDVRGLLVGLTAHPDQAEAASEIIMAVVTREALSVVTAPDPDMVGRSQRVVALMTEGLRHAATRHGPASD